MNLLPFVSFWYRHGDNVKALFGSHHRGLKLFIGLLHANAGIIKEYWPAANKDGMLDDFIQTVDDASYSTLTGDTDGRAI